MRPNVDWPYHACADDRISLRNLDAHPSHAEARLLRETCRDRDSDPGCHRRPCGDIIAQARRTFGMIPREARDTIVSVEPPLDPILTRFREALDASYGGKIARVVLFGSRARSDARPDSDYDIAVFLNDTRSFGAEALALAEIEADILAETGVLINAWPWPAAAYEDRTGLMREVRRDGREL